MVEFPDRVMDTLNSHIRITPATAVLIGTLFVAAFLFYRWLLPKPLPGIPYNPEAAKSIFGDIPSMLDHLKTHKTITDWMLDINMRHKSPITQQFSNLFGKPWVVISDYREAQVWILLPLHYLY
jgi:hypothetical protein